MENQWTADVGGLDLPLAVTESQREADGVQGNALRVVHLYQRTCSGELRSVRTHDSLKENATAPVIEVGRKCVTGLSNELDSKCFRKLETESAVRGGRYSECGARRDVGWRARTRQMALRGNGA